MAETFLFFIHSQRYTHRLNHSTQQTSPLSISFCGPQPCGDVAINIGIITRRSADAPSPLQPGEHWSRFGHLCTGSDNGFTHHARLLIMHVINIIISSV